MSEHYQKRPSPLTGDQVSFVVSDSPQVPKLRLCLESEDQLNRNAIINFNLLQHPKEASTLQTLVFLLLRFDGWAHNGGFGHGFEVLEGTRKHKGDLLDMFSFVEAQLHRQALEDDDERAYYQLSPDLPEILVAFVRENLGEFAVVSERCA